MSFLIQSLNTFITKQKSEKRKQKEGRERKKKIQNEKNEPGQKNHLSNYNKYYNDMFFVVTLLGQGLILRDPLLGSNDKIVPIQT